MRTLHSRKSRVVAGSVSAGIIAVVGTSAFAFWSDQQAEGKATTAQTSNLVKVTQTSFPNDLVPGGSPQSFSINLTNTSSSQTVHVSKVKVAVRAGWTYTRTGTAGPCTASDFATTDVDINGDFSPSSSYDYTTATVQLKDTGVDQENCKYVEVPLTFTIQS